MCAEPGQRVRAVTLLFLLWAGASACSGSASGARSVSAPGGPARIEAALSSSWVIVTSFAAEENVTLYYDATNDGTVDATKTQLTDATGTARFDLGGEGPLPGSRITATSATLTRQMIVDVLRIERADPLRDLVSGIAPASNTVDIQLLQAGIPVVAAGTRADRSGAWTQDLSGIHDLEDGREVRASVADQEGNITTVSLRAVTPVISAEHAQYGSDSVTVRNFAPGTTVRLQVDFGNDGGPAGGFDVDVVRTVGSAFGTVIDLGAHGMLRAHDRIIATGGGWTKELVAVPLRIERADPATDVISGTASASSGVAVAVLPPGGDSTPVAAASVIAGPADGTWTSGPFGNVDLEPGSQVMASVTDDDGDETVVRWIAGAPRFAVTTGSGSVDLVGFAKGTSVRVRVDRGGNGSYESDRTSTVDGRARFSVRTAGSVTPGPGDIVEVTGGGWTRRGRLVPVTVALVRPDRDTVRGTAPPGARVAVTLGALPGSKADAPTARRTVNADRKGAWSVDLSGRVDIVAGQQVSASVSDAEGNETVAVAEAKNGKDARWPKPGFEDPVADPPLYTTKKAGSTFTVRFGLGGFRGDNILDSHPPASALIQCGTNPVRESGEPVVFDGSDGIGYDGSTGQYALTWTTRKAWRDTCRQLVIRLADGSVIRANFRFTR